MRVIVQLVGIWYGCTLTITFLSSSTSASFTSSQEKMIEFQAGNWWDGSVLEFNNESGEVNACSSTDINVEIRNNGFSMIGPTTYEVYFNNGAEPIAMGSISPISAGNTTTLSFSAESEGSYVFKAYQRPMFEGNTEIWSDTITVACVEEEQEEKIEDRENKEEGKEEQAPPEELNPSEQTPVNKPTEEEPVENNSEKTPDNVEGNDTEKSNEDSSESTSSLDGETSIETDNK